MTNVADYFRCEEHEDYDLDCRVCCLDAIAWALHIAQYGAGMLRETPSGRIAVEAVEKLRESG